MKTTSGTFDAATADGPDGDPLSGNTSPAESAGGYDVAIGYLRAFLTATVVAHHAVLAYYPYVSRSASWVSQPRTWQAFPILDARRWLGFSVFVSFNDIYFMALMFFLSGLFVWKSLRSRGTGGFLRQRIKRLGAPFAAGALILAPLAYYPSYLATGADPGPGAYWRQWLSLGEWPAGPAWFLWVLLVFDCLAAELFARYPRGIPAFRRISSAAYRRPAAAFWPLVVASAAGYVPLALIFGPIGWTGFGPFAFQTSRLLHYAIYFLAGVGLGAVTEQPGPLSVGGRLERRWYVWLIAALASFVAAAALAIVSLNSGRPNVLVGVIGSLTFVLSCAASSFCLLALFLRFGRRPSRIADSLRDNAYGIYLIHYVFVVWLQYLLLAAPVAAIAKGTVVFLGALALSWGSTIAARRIPAVARIV